MGEINDWRELPCYHCGHPARRHTVHTGPCADCWEGRQSICKTFRPADPLLATRLLDAAITAFTEG